MKNNSIMKYLKSIYKYKFIIYVLMIVFFILEDYYLFTDIFHLKAYHYINDFLPAFGFNNINMLIFIFYPLALAILLLSPILLILVILVEFQTSNSYKWLKDLRMGSIVLVLLIHILEYCVLNMNYFNVFDSFITFYVLTIIFYTISCVLFINLLDILPLSNKIFIGVTVLLIKGAELYSLNEAHHSISYGILFIASIIQYLLISLMLLNVEKQDDKQYIKKEMPTKALVYLLMLLSLAIVNFVLNSTTNRYEEASFWNKDVVNSNSIIQKLSWSLIFNPNRMEVVKNINKNKIIQELNIANNNQNILDKIDDIFYLPFGLKRIYFLKTNDLNKTKRIMVYYVIKENNNTIIQDSNYIQIRK